MSDQTDNQATPYKALNAKTLMEKVRPIQERARREGFVSGQSNDKQMMDKAWGEDLADTQGTEF